MLEGHDPFSERSAELWFQFDRVQWDPKETGQWTLWRLRRIFWQPLFLHQ